MQGVLKSFKRENFDEDKTKGFIYKNKEKKPGWMELYQDILTTGDTGHPYCVGNIVYQTSSSILCSNQWVSWTIKWIGKACHCLIPLSLNSRNKQLIEERILFAGWINL